MKNTVTTTISTIVFAMAAIFAGQSAAATLSLDPPAQNIAPGSQAVVELKISGLGNFLPPSLGAFLVELAFDDTILGLDSVAYGSFLGDPGDPADTDIITTKGPGVISLDAFSFLSESELDILQPEAFILATLIFSGTRAGNSEIGYGMIDLSDATGMFLDPALIAGSVTVVPLPGSIVLACGALCGLAVVRRKHHEGERK